MNYIDHPNLLWSILFILYVLFFAYVIAPYMPAISGNNFYGQYIWATMILTGMIYRFASVYFGKLFNNTKSSDYYDILILIIVAYTTNIQLIKGSNTYSLNHNQLSFIYLFMAVISGYYIAKYVGDKWLFKDQS